MVSVYQVQCVPLPLPFGHVSSSIAKRVLCRPFVLCRVFKFGVHVARSLALVAVVLLAPVRGVSRFCLPCAPFPALLINRWLNRLRRHRRRRMAPPTMAPSAAAPALPTAGTQQTSSCFPPRTHACLPTHACRHQYAHSPAHGAPGASCSSRWAAPASRACCSPALSCSPPAGAPGGGTQRRALPAAALRPPSPPCVLQVAAPRSASRIASSGGPVSFLVALRT